MSLNICPHQIPINRRIIKLINRKGKWEINNKEIASHPEATHRADTNLSKLNGEQNSQTTEQRKVCILAKLMKTLLQINPQ